MSSTTGKGDTLCRYFTPPELAEVVVKKLVDGGIIRSGETILEPHAGGGAWVRAFDSRGFDVTACDIEPGPGMPWLQEDFLTSDRRADWIVGNPPFTGAEEHVEVALSRARVGVVFLLRLGFLASKKRMDLWRKHTPSAVWVLVERPSFSGGGTDSADYCIVVWRKSVMGQNPVMQWLSWKGGAA